jgi:hypothetical protein
LNKEIGKCTILNYTIIIVFKNAMHYMCISFIASRYLGFGIAAWGQIYSGRCKLQVIGNKKNTPFCKIYPSSHTHCGCISSWAFGKNKYPACALLSDVITCMF